MNERGIISLTALCVMFMLSITIAGVSNLAARQADIIRYYQIESKLQNLAESYFNMAISNLTKNCHFYGNLYVNFDNMTSEAHVYDDINIDDMNAKVTIYIKRNSKSAPSRVLAVMALAEIPGYNYNKYPVYRRVCGRMEMNPDTLDDDDNNDKYEFKSYIY